jgi:hypothetical protein
MFAVEERDSLADERVPRFADLGGFADAGGMNGALSSAGRTGCSSAAT